MQYLQIIPMEKYASEFPSIYPAKNFVPEWFRKSPGRMNGDTSEVHRKYPSATTGTYKKCVPFFDAMTAGYIVVLTADIEVIKDEN